MHRGNGKRTGYAPFLFYFAAILAKIRPLCKSKEERTDIPWNETALLQE